VTENGSISSGFRSGRLTILAGSSVSTSMETDLENRVFPTFEDLDPGQDWPKCWVEDGKFNGAGGPQKLEEIPATFLRWATKEPFE
jgi:hypothetical protein